MITIVDYGVCNVGSIRSMLRKLGAACQIASDRETVAAARKLILPGVGAFDTGIIRLRESGLSEILDHKVRSERLPILGICLGMQLMTRGSEEGRLPGLGWIEGGTVRLQVPTDSKLKVPHMGWNSVTVTKPSRLFADTAGDHRFYFVHSYHVRCDSAADPFLMSNHGTDFVAGFERDNIVGVQFHPEKSHRHGLKLLGNFVKHY